jgi:hypothetical protein
MFGFQTDGFGSHNWYLDTVSVFDVIAPGTQLLQNPGFDNSTTAVIDWSQYCGSSCSSPGTITSTSCQSINCYVNQCSTTSGSTPMDFLSQSFPTTIGHIYTISFWLIDTGSGFNGLSKVYVDIS